MTLWLVRHAQPLIAPGICYGQLDMPADPSATQSCALELVKILPPGIRIICSPLQRCEQLAQAIRGLEPLFAYETDARIKEMNFGAWEGVPWADIGKDPLDAWTAAFATSPAGGTGESVARFMDRVANALDDVTSGGNPNSAITSDTLWITHAGVIRAAGLIACGMRRIERADQWPTAAPAYGQWCKLIL